MNRTLEQLRASYTLRFVTEFKGNKGELYTHIQKTPVRILQNGLGQALAFLLADNEGETGDDRKASWWLYDHLQAWLCGPAADDRPCRVYSGQECNLMKQLVEGNREQYMLAQEEAIRLFSWLKKFADAYLKE